MRTGILEKNPDPVSHIAPTSPAALDHVVKTCLEKNPDERFQTAQDGKLQLKGIAGGGAKSGGAAPATPTLRAEYPIVELNYGASKAFGAALAAEQPKLQGETLWYRLVVGGNAPCYVRIRPRASLASILHERADQALADKVNGWISKMTVETLNSNMLVNVTPEPAR